MGFDTDISGGVAKMRVATLLVDIFRLRQRTKNPLKYVHTKLKYGNLVAISDSGTQEFFRYLQETNSELTYFFSISQVERSKIR